MFDFVQVISMSVCTSIIAMQLRVCFIAAYLLGPVCIIGADYNLVRYLSIFVKLNKYLKMLFVCVMVMEDCWMLAR